MPMERHLASTQGPASLFPGTRARDSGHGRRDGLGRLLGLLLLAVAALLPFGHRDSFSQLDLGWTARTWRGALLFSPAWPAAPAASCFSAGACWCCGG